MTMIEIGREAKNASRELARLSTKEKNDLLVALAEELKVKEEEILQVQEEQDQVHRLQGSRVPQEVSQ